MILTTIASKQSSCHVKPAQINLEPDSEKGGDSSSDIDGIEAGQKGVEKGQELAPSSPLDTSDKSGKYSNGR